MRCEEYFILGHQHVQCELDMDHTTDHKVMTFDRSDRIHIKWHRETLRKDWLSRKDEK